MSVQSSMTAEQLLQSSGRSRCELIDGELVEMSPSGYWHAHLHFVIAGKLQAWLQEHPVGKGFGGEGGFLIARNPDTVRAPDVAFVRTERLPDTFGPGFFPGPPDLAVEVISPSDSAWEVTEKVAMWLHAGTVCVWTIDSHSRVAMIHRLENERVVAREADPLVCEELLPGLSIDVSSLFL